MAFTDNLNELWGIPQLEQQKERAVQLVREYLQEVTAASKKMRGLQMGIGGMENMAQVKANAKEVETLTNQQIKTIKTLADAKLKEAKAEEALSKARLNAARLQANQDKENLAIQKDLERQAKVNTKALLDFTKQQERATNEAAKQSNAYEMLKRQYREAANEAKRLGVELGVDSARFKEASAAAFAMHQQLLQVEGAVGQMQRQVGNYNVVGMQFQQLLRELPNAGISARTFIMAISNNISYFAEAVADSIRQGNGWKSVLKSVGGSLFSVVGIINIAVTALTFFTTAMTKNKEEAKSAGDAYDDLVNSLKKYTDATVASTRQIRRVVGTSSEDARRELELLQAKGASDKQIFEARQRYNKALSKDASTEINLLNSIIQSVNEFSAEYNKAKDILIEGETKEDVYRRTFVTPLAKVLEERLNLSEKQALAEAENLGKNPEVIAELTRQKDEALQIYKDAENAQLISDAQFQKELTEQRKKAEEERIKKLIDRQKYERSIEVEYLKSTEQIKAETRLSMITANYDRQLLKIETEEAKLLATNERLYDMGVISYEQYEAEKLKIQNDYSQKRIQLEIETIKQTINSTSVSGDEKLKLEKRLAELELSLLRNNNSDKLREQEEYNKASQQLERERAERIKQIRQELTSALMQLGRVVLDGERRRLEQSKKRIDDEKELELAGIEASSATQEEAARRKFALEQRVLQQKQQIQKKEEQIERNRFLLEQAGALARVFINANEAVGKITAQAAVLSSNPVTAALAAQAYAQIPLVYGSAAVQAGLIAAQTLMYAEGTPDGGHKGGAAIVGEAGEAEYVKEPNKAGYWVTKPTYFKNMPTGTEVTPLHKLEASGLEKLDGKVLNAIMLQGGGNSAKTEALLAEAVGKLGNIEKKPQSQWIVKGNAMYEIVTKGNATNKKLGSRFID